MTEINTFNQFMVAGRMDGRILILNPPLSTQGMTADEAINLATYLVAVAEAHRPTHSFEEVLRAVRAT